MRRVEMLSALFALLLACAAPVRAEVSLEGSPPKPDEFDLVETYHPSAGAVAGAIAIDLVYVPVRFAITLFGAFLGGFEGFISGGNEKAASIIFGLTDGSQVITPAMLEGRERWRFGRYGF